MIPWRSNGTGRVGNGCVGLVFSFGTSDCGTGRSSIGQIGSTGLAIQHEQERTLRRLRERLHRSTVHAHVEQHRRARQIPVPHIVMHGLVMPLALPGLDVQRDDAVGEQRVAGPMAAVVIAGGHFGRHVDESELRIGAHLRPRAGVAVVFRRTLQPGVVAELALLRDGVEDPQPLAGANVVAAHVALRVLHRPRR